MKRIVRLEWKNCTVSVVDAETGSEIESGFISISYAKVYTNAFGYEVVEDENP